MHVRLVHLDIAELDGGVALDDAVGRGLAHDLRIDDGVLRHVDDEVAEDEGGAGEAPAFRQAADLLVALLLRALLRNVLERGDDLVLGEVAFLHLDLTAPAGGAPAAHAFDIDAELSRGFEDGRADGEAAALAGGHEEDEGILARGFAHGVLSPCCAVETHCAYSAMMTLPPYCAGNRPRTGQFPT